MTDAKFTPGPWFQSAQGGHIRALVDNIPRKVCNFKGNTNSANDSRLIVFAPELLEALSALIDDLDECTTYGAVATLNLSRPSVRKARATLAKVWGHD